MNSTWVNTSTMLPVRQLGHGFLCRNLTLAPKETKVAAYQTLVNPHHQTEVDRIEKVQRTAARQACRRWCNQSHVAEMLEELQWPELQEQRQQASLTFYKHTRIYSLDWNRYLSEAGGNKSTRSHPLQYHLQMHIRTDRNCLSSPGQLPLELDLQPKLSLWRQLMGLSPKNKDLGLGSDMAWYACP